MVCGAWGFRYVELLHSFANNASSDFPGLLNYTSWKGTHLGDWVPAVGRSACSTLLNSHHLILDLDATATLLHSTELAASDGDAGSSGSRSGGPSGRR